MKQSDTVVVFVLFDSIREFVGEFLDSLEQQTDHDFDVLYFDDGYDDAIHLQNDIAINCLTSESALSPSEIRVKLVATAHCAGYKNLIFCDADDVMHPHRMKGIKEGLKRYDVVANDLDLYADGKVLKPGFLALSLRADNLIQRDEIIGANFFGLTNSAISLGVIDERLLSVSVLKEATIFDWLFFSLLLCSGQLQAGTVLNSGTKYRIGENNMLGTGEVDSQETLDKLLLQKTRHYSLLEQGLNELGMKNEVILRKIKDEQDDLERLKDCLVSEAHFKQFKELARQSVAEGRSVGWWSQIKSIQSLERRINE